jgi:hypothetical protein
MLVPSLGGIKFFAYTQSTPSTTWTIFHGFGAKPMVDTNVIDSGSVQKAFPISVTHVDDDNVTIVWSQPRTGYVSLAAALE